MNSIKLQHNFPNLKSRMTYKEAESNLSEKAQRKTLPRCPKIVSPAHPNPLFVLGPLLAMLCVGCVFGNSADRPKDIPTLNLEIAEHLASLPLNCVNKPYPYKPGHVLLDSSDVREPRVYHPSFYGCFDWHSAVHGFWSLVKLIKEFPDLEQRNEIERVLLGTLTAENILSERTYFEEEGRESFQRTYGWAWFLKLVEEVKTWDSPIARDLERALIPLAQHFVQSYIDFLPKLTYPIRRGVHPNTAFGLAFAHDYAVAAGEIELISVIEEVSRRFYSGDKDYPAQYELEGDNFFSPSLMEADLMRRIFDAEEFTNWFDEFLPGASLGEPKELFEPAFVSDRTDGFIVHLDGLNLSRAWCMAGVAKSLPKSHPARRKLIESAKIHAAVSLPEISSGSYEGEHWLGSFAMYMLSKLNDIE